MNKFLTILLLFLIIVGVSAQEKPDNKIDIELEKCTKENPSTQGECLCIENAAKAWDLELNKNYTILTNILNKENKEILKKAQREWILYRDKELELIGKIYYEELSGTMFHPMAYYRKLVVIKTRAIELRKYIDILELK